MNDLILVLDDDIEFIFDSDARSEEVFVDDVPHAHTYDEYSGSYEVIPSTEDDIVLSTIGKLMIDDVTVKALPIGTAEAEISGTNTVTPMVGVSGSNISLSEYDNGISVTAVGGGIASAEVSAIVTATGYTTSGTVLDSATIATASTTTSATLYIYSVVVPASKVFHLSTEASSSVYITNAGFLGVGNTGWIDIAGENVVSNGAWVTHTPTATGTYYGKTVIDGSILQIAYPVGSLYATETSTDDPATILGFGTWTKYAPTDMTWDDTDLDWANTVGTTEGIYVWKRTA